MYTLIIVSCVIFQSTLPRGERQRTGIFFDKEEYISIHAPTRGATFKQKNVAIFYIFQSTLPRGERPNGNEPVHLYATISIHAPTRGATSCGLKYSHSAVISIHAPTRGATNDTHGIVEYWLISIHAPTRGATYAWGVWCTAHANFNPRSHEGSDCSGKELCLHR